MGNLEDWSKYLFLSESVGESEIFLKQIEHIKFSVLKELCISATTVVTI
jgi:hypothetical protein